MDFGEFTITKRELLVSIAITLILIGVGFFISSKIEDVTNENNEKYFKALKIDNDTSAFEYAIKTNIGYVLANGKIKAVNGVSISDIEGTYFEISKKKEKYTKHTRQVEHTRTVSDGNGGYKTEVYYTTEEYWTWDYAGEEKFHTEKFSFLNVEFAYNTIKFNNRKYKETKQIDYYTRYVYYIIPMEFSGTLFTYIKENQINQNEFYINTSINDFIRNKENSLKGAKIGFWFLWGIVICLIDFGYMFLENKYLED